MRHSFSYSLLITCLLLLASCESHVVKTGFETENISVSEELGKVDSSIIKLYQPFKETLDADMKRVISVSAFEMEKDKPESLLTNFLADLLLEESTLLAKEKSLNIIPDVSFFNYGGIRTPLPKGDITVGKIFELMPFENQLVFVKVTGEKMKAFLDYIAGHGGDSVGGAKLVISGEKATKITIGGKAFDTNKAYWLATNDYIAAGGDGLSMLQDNLDYVESGDKIRDMIIAYMERKQTQGEDISPKLDGRISYE